MPAPQLPTPGITVRPARPEDLAAAELVFQAAPEEYALLAGSAERARRILASLWARPGHSASFEHALVAEIDATVVGVLIGFPVRDRYRLHRGLLRASLPHLPASRWPLLLAALPQLVLASPRPPRGAYYVGTIAVARHAHRRGVASTLGAHAERAAMARGFRQVAAHTGTRHAVARRGLERYGLQARRARRNGYALYVKELHQDA